MNDVKISGNLTKDAELITTQNGHNLFKLSIANNDESKKNSKGNYDKVVSFFDVEFWSNSVQYFSPKLIKGASVTVQGRLKQNLWMDEGQKRSKIIIVATVGLNKGFAVVIHDRVSQQHTTDNNNEKLDNIPF